MAIVRGVIIRLKTILAVMLLLWVGGSLALAQDATPEAPPATPTPSPDVQIEASDGRKLYGTYYDAGGDAPAVLLLHQLYTNRSSWTPLVNPLREAGFKVLVIDLRGYGQTRGSINWTQAQDDTLRWAEWLRGQPGVNKLLMGGSSMGANLALVGCAGVDGCAGVVALSPGLNYFGVTTDSAIASGRPTLIAYADRDRYPKDDVPAMQQIPGAAIEVIVYEGRDHGVDLFRAHDDLAGAIVGWLAGR
jgi:pimeloyl-ACP methyl ester carboxylesterase